MDEISHSGQAGKHASPLSGMSFGELHLCQGDLKPFDPELALPPLYDAAASATQLQQQTPDA
jgi:hypothetical protein